jgi:acyl dehydratase
MPEGYDIEAVRKEYVGKESAVVQGRYPVEYDPIRRYCHMVGDLNPLYLDPEFAKSQGYRDVVCPAPIVRNFALAMPWPPAPPAAAEQNIRVPAPGNRAINMGNEMIYLKPICVGDRLSAKQRVVDVYQKGIRLDPEAVWTVSETVIMNESGEEVFLERNYGLTHRSPEEVAASQGQAQQ